MSTSIKGTGILVFLLLHNKLSVVKQLFTWAEAQLSDFSIDLASGHLCICNQLAY